MSSVTGSEDAISNSTRAQAVATTDGAGNQLKALAEGFQADDADFTLISSDSVAFKVHKYHLFAASIVLRELLGLGNSETTFSEPSMTFVDPVTESAGSVSIFLALTYGRDITKAQHRFIIPSIGFLRKYDCQPAFSALRVFIKSQLVASDESCMNPYRVFQAASMLDDHLTCAEAIKRGGTQNWNKKSECKSDRGVHQFLPNRSVFDPATMGVKDMEIIPPTYFLALVRAVDAARSDVTVRAPLVFWEDVAREFRRIMQLD